jgi:hypothetical protein
MSLRKNSFAVSLALHSRGTVSSPLTKHDANERLKIGTKKADVSQFFVENGIPFEISESEAIGTLRTSGCAPLGCGTDSALIGVRVKLDKAGAVTDAPKIVGMYTDCL